jgi:hypothetical protein
MRNLLLSITLIAAPVAVFSVGYRVFAPITQVQAALEAPSSLGELSGFITIITDVEKISATGDFILAESRITDFETAWDKVAGALRPINSNDWGNIDDAADAALSALRAKTPDAANVKSTLVDLQTALANPSLSPANAPKAVALVAGIPTTDANGRALPCEVMLKDLAAKLTSATLAPDVLAQATDFQTKALERCNADDDARADGFSARALALLSK